MIGTCLATYDLAASLKQPRTPKTANSSYWRRRKPIAAEERPPNDSRQPAYTEKSPPQQELRNRVMILIPFLASQVLRASMAHGVRGASQADLFLKPVAVSVRLLPLASRGPRYTR